MASRPKLKSGHAHPSGNRRWRSQRGDIGQYGRRAMLEWRGVNDFRDPTGIHLINLPGYNPGYVERVAAFRSGALPKTSCRRCISMSKTPATASSEVRHRIRETTLLDAAKTPYIPSPLNFARRSTNGKM